MLAADSYSYNQIRREQLAQHNDEVGLLTGNLTTDQVSRPVSIPLSILKAQEEKQKRDQRATDDLFFYVLMDQMRNRLADLERGMAEHFAELRKKYGENVADGMAQTFLSEEEYARLRTDEEKLQALADKMLDENGNIKEQYAHLREAEYLKQWREAQQLKLVINKYENATALDSTAKQEITGVAVSVGLAGQDNMYVQSQNIQVKDTVEQVMNETRMAQAQFDDGASPLVFKP